MGTNVRTYANTQLIDRVQSLETYEYIPEEFWTIGIRSLEDEFNKFDDKFYLMEGEHIKKIYQGTTNAGAKGLKNFESYNPEGCAVLKSDVIIYDSHKRGISKGREVFRQNKSFPYYRDNDKDNYAEEIGEVHNDIIYAHIHDVKMGNVDEYKEYINGWSLACQVLNNGAEWAEYMELTKEQEFMTYCLLKEFDPNIS